MLGVPTPRKITPRGASPCRRCRWHLEFWSGARNEGYPRRTGRVLTESRILPCRGRAELAIPLPSSRTCFAPSRSILAARCPQRRTLALTPVRYPGQDASGGGAGYRPRVLKRYYEPVINLADTLRRKRRSGLLAHRLPWPDGYALTSQSPGSTANRGSDRNRPGRPCGDGPLILSTTHLEPPGSGRGSLFVSGVLLACSVRRFDRFFQANEPRRHHRAGLSADHPDRHDELPVTAANQRDQF